MIAEYERAQIAERTRRGKAHRPRAGSQAVMSGAPYGYRYIKKADHREEVFRRKATAMSRASRLLSSA
jgi:hypothetical protein